jgi:hypothetical protein
VSTDDPQREELLSRLADVPRSPSIPDPAEVLASLPADMSFTFEMDLASMLAVFGAAHLGIRHPAVATTPGIRDQVIGYTNHLAAEVAAAGLEQLATLLRAGLNPEHDS